MCIIALLIIGITNQYYHKLFKRVYYIMDKCVGDTFAY